MEYQSYVSLSLYVNYEARGDEPKHIYMIANVPLVVGSSYTSFGLTCVALKILFSMIYLTGSLLNISSNSLLTNYHAENYHVMYTYLG